MTNTYNEFYKAIALVNWDLGEALKLMSAHENLTEREFVDAWFLSVLDFSVCYFSEDATRYTWNDAIHTKAEC